MDPKQSKRGYMTRPSEEPAGSRLPLPAAVAAESDWESEGVEDPEGEPLFHPVCSSNA